MKKIFSVIFLSLVLSSFAIAADKLSPTEVKGATTVDSTKAKALFDDGALFIDTRKNSDWDAGRIPDAIHLELKSNFTDASLAAEAKKEEPIVCYCNGHKCLRSSVCAEKAVSWGFKKVYYYRDGFPAWKAAGFPVE